MLHALIMPPSLSVHTVRMIVSANGDFEFGEWITGEDGTFFHKRLQFSKEEIDALIQSLTPLDIAEPAINFDSIECDFGEYEQPTRKLLRFWARGEERGAFLPSSKFYNDHEIKGELRNRYEAAFDAVISKLPVDWIT
ncbi:MAG: hypothetical protein ACK6DU_10870 [Planctomycetota bacterium]